MPAGAAAHSLVRSGGGLVSYTSADATSLNGLAVRPSGNRVEFRDDRVDGGMDPGTCTPGAVDSQGFIVQTFCSLDGVRRVRIDLGDREDTAAVSLQVPVTLLGGTGADGLTAGPLGDEVSGGEGNDSAAGGAGDDVLSGDQGIDVLDGGAGTDRIAARDGEADTVRCGPGGDTVDADGVGRRGRRLRGRDAGRPPRRPPGPSTTASRRSWTPAPPRCSGSAARASCGSTPPPASGERWAPPASSRPPG